MIITPKDFAPRPYQGIVTDFILDTPRCGVWSSMGTGKTPATLNALDILQMLDDRPVLVVAPLRVAEKISTGIDTRASLICPFQ